MSLAIGTKAPDFKLPSTTGADFTLSKDVAESACILFFYPKDFTPGCTTEVCAFRDEFSVFSELDIPVYGISLDSIASHKKFRAKHNLPFHLLSDPTAEVASDYDAKVPFLKMTKRVTYLLDKEHKVVACFDKMFGSLPHIKAMIDALKS